MRYHKLILPTLLTACMFLLTAQNTTAQSRRSKKQNTTKIDPKLHESVQYRSIGPFRGGRSAAAETFLHVIRPENQNLETREIFACNPKKSWEQSESDALLPV